jgi:hypothetical protein
MVLLALRMGCYALLPRAPSPWVVLPVELLHGAWTAWIAQAIRPACS